MSNFSTEDGLNYLLNQLMAIYLSRFSELWGPVDVDNVREIWKSDLWLGKWLTHKPTLDWVLQNLYPKYPPTLLELRKLCLEAPCQPPKEEPMMIEQKLTQEQLSRQAREAQKAREFIKNFARGACKPKKSVE